MVSQRCSGPTSFNLWERNFANMNKLKILIRGPLSRIICWFSGSYEGSPKGKTEARNSENELWWLSQSWSVYYKKELTGQCWLWRWKGATPVKEYGVASGKLDKARYQVLPENLQKGAQFCQHLDFSPMKPIHISIFHTVGRIHLFCLKSLTLW